jgi:hypothetical protein
MRAVCENSVKAMPHPPIWVVVVRKEANQKPLVVKRMLTQPYDREIQDSRLPLETYFQT